MKKASHSCRQLHETWTWSSCCRDGPKRLCLPFPFVLIRPTSSPSQHAPRKYGTARCVCPVHREPPSSAPPCVSHLNLNLYSCNARAKLTYLTDTPAQRPRRHVERLARALPPAELVRYIEPNGSAIAGEHRPKSFNEGSFTPCDLAVVLNNGRMQKEASMRSDTLVKLMGGKDTAAAKIGRALRLLISCMHQFT